MSEQRPAEDDAEFGAKDAQKSGLGESTLPPEGLAPSPGLQPPKGLDAPIISVPIFNSSALKFDETGVAQHFGASPQLPVDHWQPVTGQPPLVQGSPVAPSPVSAPGSQATQPAQPVQPPQAPAPVTPEPAAQIQQTVQQTVQRAEQHAQQASQQAVQQAQQLDQQLQQAAVQLPQAVQQPVQQTQQQFQQQVQQQVQQVQQQAQQYGQQATPRAGTVGVRSLPSRTGLSRGATIVLAIGGGAIALVLLIAAVSSLGTMLRGPSSDPSPGANSAASAGSATASPAETVEGFLTAVAAGDSATALEFIQEPHDASMLTDEVLADSLSRAPMTDIVIGETRDGDFENSLVSVSYSLGDTLVNRDYSLWGAENGWQISDALMPVSFNSFSGLDVTVNGTRVQEDLLQFFPGSYVVNIDDTYFATPADTNTVLIASEDDTLGFYEIEPELTPDALAIYRSLLTESLTECLALNTITTPCGMDLNLDNFDGVTPIEGSVQRTLTSEGQESLAATQPRVLYSEPSTVSSSDYFAMTVTFEGEKDGVVDRYEVLFGNILKNPLVNFSESPLKVTWK